MARTVTFTYATGVMPKLFCNARLAGSWDATGRYSESWSATRMQEATGQDGCPAFRATADLEPAAGGQTFHWGVRLDGPAGAQLWGITTEEKSTTSVERRRSFFLSDDPNGEGGDQTYRLNWSRTCGAQRYVAGDGSVRLRFCVWAPNAREVAVCIANVWQHGNDPRENSLLVKTSDPVMQPYDRRRIAGGYIAASASGPGDGGLHHDWEPIPMQRDRDGFWWTAECHPDLANFAGLDHVPYMFRIVKDNGGVAFRTDLYSRCQIGSGDSNPDGQLYQGLIRDLDGSVSCSVIVDPDRVTRRLLEPAWPERYWAEQEEFFADPAPDASIGNQKLSDLIIYELHIGALGAGRRAAEEPGTLDDALALLDYLQDLGVNAIELLPLSEFGGGGAGWGYATSHYFALEYAGGGRDQYKWFVRECHARGIAVILDVVYNHYSHNAERAEWMYDTDSPEKNAYYWYEGQPGQYTAFNDSVPPERRGYGGYLDNVSSAWAPRYWEEPVRNMFISSAIAQVTEFRIDGFRVDQTTSIRSYNRLHANGDSVGSANAFGTKLLREFTRSLRFVNPRVMLMAEDHDNWDGTTTDPDRGGLGFDAAWYADFYHHLIGDTDKGSDYAKLIKTAGFGDDRPLAMDYFAGALQATSGGTKVVYHESHDEAGNGALTDRTIRVAVNGAPLFGETRRYAEARCRFAAGITMLSAGIPMFLFGEEAGAQNKFLYNHVLEYRENLYELRNISGRHLFAFYKALIAFRRGNPALRSPNIDVFFVHNEHRLIAFRRWDARQEFLVFASLNNSAFDRPSYTFRAERIPAGDWREVFNSDAAMFGGNNAGNGGRVLGCPQGSFECIVPANGVLVFARA